MKYRNAVFTVCLASGTRQTHYFAVCPGFGTQQSEFQVSNNPFLGDRPSIVHDDMLTTPFGVDVPPPKNG